MLDADDVLGAAASALDVGESLEAPITSSVVPPTTATRRPTPRKTRLLRSPPRDGELDSGAGA